ncbi:MAG TPA: glycosyltransferase [Sphingomicrobium sp.]|nr:glycosyltransferase [Sphingomicrobium sp.]
MARPSPGATGRRVLFLSYDGLTDPLGRSQILPYLQGLAGRGHAITVVSFEKPGRSESERGAVVAACAEAGIDWQPQTYHARPPVLSTLRDVRAMARAAERLQRGNGFDIVHCRSYISALVGLRMKRRHGLRFLFDMRGFYVDERIDMGLWRPGNPLFALIIGFFRKREAAFFTEADAIVSLTHAGADRLKTWTDVLITVIPTCVDFDHFRLRSAEEKAAARRTLGIPADAAVLAYLGSISDRMLAREMLEAFRVFEAKRRNAVFLVIATQGEEELRAKAKQLGIAQEKILFRPRRREEVPAAVGAADAGIAFYRPGEAMAGCSPTKLGEMLALGIPVLLNSGVGDVDRIVADIGAGAVVPSFDEQSLAQGVEALAHAPPPDRIRGAAQRWFDLQTGVEIYHQLYTSLTAKAGDQAANGQG